jgi:putative PIG3 family NAD(P)H quinone oxidoreductase
MTAQEMTAIRISQPGGPEVLEACTQPVPEPAADEILIKVAAAGINRPDILQRMGVYPPPKGASELPGLEVAGEVVAVGAAAKMHKVGEQVCALVNGGGYAEYCVAPDVSAMSVPAGLSMAEAAAIPETYFTVWHNVFQRGGLQEGEWLLVHGGTSGIGTTAIQLANAFGSKILATAGSDDKCTACQKLGAERCINYREADFVEAVQEATGGHGADVILDMVGGSYIERNYQAAALDGRIVQIAFLGGAKTEVDFTLLMMKRLVHTGSTLRARSNAFKGELARTMEMKVWPLIADGKIKPIMHATFPLKEAVEAHQLMDAGTHIGKIVLTID